MSKSVYLSPSTQEHNIGAGSYGTEEKRMNELADYIQKDLERHGVTVYRNKPEMTLGLVVADSNSKHPDLHFAVHSNAGNGKARGCVVFCYKYGGVGEQLARNVYAELEPLTPTGDHGVQQGKDYYGPGKSMFELERTDAPAALVEVAFHDNQADAEWITGHMPIIGAGIVKGILKTLGITYKGIVNLEAELAIGMANMGYITSPDYWELVLEGKQPAKPEYLKILFSRITKIS